MRRSKSGLNKPTRKQKTKREVLERFHLPIIGRRGPLKGKTLKMRSQMKKERMKKQRF